MQIRKLWSLYNDAIATVVNHVAFFGVVAAALVSIATIWTAYLSPAVRVFAPYSYVFVISVLVIVWAQIRVIALDVRNRATAANRSDTPISAEIVARFEVLDEQIAAMSERLSAVKTPSQEETREAAELVWLTPIESLAAYEASLTNEMQRVTESYREAKQQSDEVGKKVPKEVHPWGIAFWQPKSPEEESLKQEYLGAESAVQTIVDTYKKLQVVRLQRLSRRLEQGEFVAQGFEKPRKHGTLPITIPKEEWRLLSFDLTNDTLQEVTGPEVNYIALRIAKVPRRPGGDSV